jgi:two-component system nitrogen regulation response regulator GlnG
MGYSVEATENADSIMNKFCREPIYDVILTDVRMPGTNGFEFYSRIIEKQPEMKSRIIFITGDVMGADVNAFLNQNKLPYLIKPFDIELVKETIDQVIKSERESSSDKV